MVSDGARAVVVCVWGGGGRHRGTCRVCVCVFVTTRVRACNRHLVEVRFQAVAHLDIEPLVRRSLRLGLQDRKCDKPVSGFLSWVPRDLALK